MRLWWASQWKYQIGEETEMVSMFGIMGGRRARKRGAAERKKVLQENFLNNRGGGRSSEEAKSAIAYCEYLIGDYDGWFEWNECRWVGWQRVVIIGSVVATLAGVITLPTSWIAWIPEVSTFGWLRGVPAAIVTIAAGYLSSFTYREDAVRQEVTKSVLWNELTKYLAKAEPYNRNEAEDTSAFVITICRIVDTELHGWRTLVVGDQIEASSRANKQEIAVAPPKPIRPTPAA
jgi:hypothetical protein